MVLSVRVAFSYRGQDWSHSFNVEKGSTVLGLKELMLRPEGGSKADVDSFELRRQGRRVPDFELIQQESSFDFAFLGPVEGARKATEDAVQAKERPQQPQQPAERPREEARPPDAKPRELANTAQEVEVRVRHASEENSTGITVKVMSSATILDVRHAVMAAIGESKISEVKLVKKTGTAFTTLANEEPIGDRREFLAMGRSLEAPSASPAAAPAAASAAPVAPAAAPAAPATPPAAEPAQAPAAPAVPQGASLSFKVTSSEDFLSLELELPAGRTIGDLKQKICDEVKRGPVSEVKVLVVDREFMDDELAEAIEEGDRRRVLIEGIDFGPPYDVQVTVAHASSDRTLRVTVHDTASMLDLRKAVASQLGSNVADLRIVKKSSAGLQAIHDSERLNGRTEFLWATGVPDAPPAAAPAGAAAAVAEDKDLAITICLDRSLGFTQEVTVKKGSTIRELKVALADGDPTKRTRPEDFSLGLSSNPGSRLSDDTRITEAHLALDLIAGAA